MESVNLCPICGLPSETTSIVCIKHISITYDSKGKVISYTDYKQVNPSYNQIQRWEAVRQVVK